MSVKHSKEVQSPDKEVSGLGGSLGTLIKICCSVMFFGKVWVGRLGKGLVKIGGTCAGSGGWISVSASSSLDS